MSACTFFGHRECPLSVKPKLQVLLVELIEKHDVGRFYVGQQGSFDVMVCAVLRELVEQYPHIRYYIVLERLPVQQGRAIQSPANTIFPEGLEAAPPRWAVSRRNEWMLKQSDYVVTYITHDWGGAARFAARAAQQRKKIINVAET